MATSSNHIIDLVYRSLAEDLNAGEQQELEQWLQASPKRVEWYASLNGEAMAEAMQRTPAQREQLRQEMHARIRMATGLSTLLHTQTTSPARTVATTHRVHFLKTAWFRYAAAILILIGIGTYLWSDKQKNTSQNTELADSGAPSTIAPGSNKATLTLSDGRKIELIPGTNNITETGTTIKNVNGRLEYNKANQVVFNTMSTARGGQYQLRLPDGTAVWLNAASSITYPTAFVSNTREVTVTGEAYFEVKANAGKPFIVKTKSQDITVLGTSFNVNAYEEESEMKISLLEGAVKIGDAILQPGQAYVNGRIIQTNTDQDVAWKNGLFNFQDKKFDEVMRQLARWYDITVVYENGVPNKEYGGELKRNLTLSQILKILENSGVKFQLQGRKVTVKP